MIFLSGSQASRIYRKVKNGTTVDSEKVGTIKEWKPRNLVKGARYILELASIYWFFVANFSDIVTPSTHLT